MKPTFDRAHFAAICLLFSLQCGTSAQVLFFDNFEQFALGTDLTSTNYTPASGPSSASVVTTVENGSPTIAATNFFGSTWTFFDNSVPTNKNQYKGILSSIQTNQVLRVAWKMWIQATNSGPGAFLLSVPVQDANPSVTFNPPLLFMDTGVINALTNGIPPASPFVPIGNWGGMAGTAMTNVLKLNYPAGTFSYSLNGQTLATLPLGPYFTNAVDAIYFDALERSAGSLGNRFAIDDVKVEAASALSQFCFGEEIQSTNTASVAYDPDTGVFQFTNAANSSEDYAYLPLGCAASDSITTSNNWTATLAVDISARTMTPVDDRSVHVAIGLVVGSAIPTNVAFIFAGQWDNTGGGDDAILPHGWYGTAVRFGAQRSGAADLVTPLDDSQSSGNGSVYRQLSGATNVSPGSESLSNLTGVVALVYCAATHSITASYQGVPVGSYSIAGWGSDPRLTLAVWGGSGSYVLVPAGTATAGNFYAALAPILTIVRWGASQLKVFWPSPGTADFALEQSEMLVNPASWVTNSARVTDDGTNKSVILPATNNAQFFRLRRE